MTFVAPMPEQIGTAIMHFSELSGDTYQKFSSPKLGGIDQIDKFQNYMLFQWGKIFPKSMVFHVPCRLS